MNAHIHFRFARGGGGAKDRVVYRIKQFFSSKTISVL